MDEHLRLCNERIPHPQRAYAAEVAVSSPELADTVGAADRGDARVMDRRAGNTARREDVPQN